MVPMGEWVALFDADGRPTGEIADRATVRRDNLWHGATGVVVLDDDGSIYVHRRTVTKDVYPGLYDFCAGGVLQAGESPVDAALREVAEELGVDGVPLTPLGEANYEDEFTRYHAYLFSVTYNGPIRHQPEEVAWGDWVTPHALVSMLRELDFVPDTRALMSGWLAERLG